MFISYKTVFNLALVGLVGINTVTALAADYESNVFYRPWIGSHY